MKLLEESDGRLVVSLARGEMLRACIENLAIQRGIRGARISAIGAIEDPELGCYDLPSQSYDKRVFPGIWELLSMEGNISLLQGRPFLHAHVSISGHDYQALGGHLFDARVGVVVELFIDPLSTPLPRIPCAAIGLPRWEPGGALD